MTTVSRRLGRLEECLRGPVAEVSRRLRERSAELVKSSSPETLYGRLTAANRIAQQILHAALEAGQPGLALLALARVEAELKLEVDLVRESDTVTKTALGVKSNQGSESGWDLSRLEIHELQQLQWLWEKARSDLSAPIEMELATQRREQGP